MDKSHSKRYENLFHVHLNQSTLLLLDYITKNTAKEEFVAFQVRLLHTWAVLEIDPMD